VTQPSINVHLPRLPSSDLFSARLDLTNSARKVAAAAPRKLEEDDSKLALFGDIDSTGGCKAN
jgi:hypothetical protein